MFNGQFRLHENLMYENKLAKVNFAESLQKSIYNYLLCNKKIVGHYNYYSATYMSGLVTSSAFQSRKWQLIGMS